MILHFINRKDELKALEEAYISKRAENFIIYGRRRIGKTELIKEFCKDKEHFYFLAKEQKMEIEIDRFRKSFAEKFNIYLNETLKLDEIFNQILGKVSHKKKLIIIIDEFPYWVNKDLGILSEFQHLWDELLSKENIFLILCGSYISIMEEQVMGYKSPLYGRRTGQLKIEPLPIKHLKSFLPAYNTEDLIKIYGAVGTIPFYLKEMDSSINFEKNIEKTFFNKANILNSEAEFMLRQELRDVGVYLNILKTIIDGSTKLSEIASKSHVDITNINKYLNTLIHLNIVKKVKPITSPEKEKRYIYKVDDNYFRFWLSYVYPYGNELEENFAFLSKILKKDFPNYMGFIFEDFCMKIIRDLDCGIDRHGTKVGSWWHGNDEIDICAINKENSQILFGECKWKEKVNADVVLAELKEKSKKVIWSNSDRREYYAVFAKSFKDKYIKEKNVYLFDLNDIKSIFLS